MYLLKGVDMDDGSKKNITESSSQSGTCQNSGIGKLSKLFICASLGLATGAVNSLVEGTGFQIVTLVPLFTACAFMAKGSAGNFDFLKNLGAFMVGTVLATCLASEAMGEKVESVEPDNQGNKIEVMESSSDLSNIIPVQPLLKSPFSHAPAFS